MGRRPDQPGRDTRRVGADALLLGHRRTIPADRRFRQLRFQAQTALDNLDGILRLSFEPAIVNGLGRNINVTALAATTNDLYLLDGVRGSVYRYYLTAQGYQADPPLSASRAPMGM